MGRLAKSARRSWKLVKETSREFWEDNVLALGAGLAYYSVFSIVPILVIVIAIAGIAFGEEAVRTEIYGQARGLVGSEGAGQIQTMMENASAHPKTGKAAALVGLATLVLGATGAFIAIQDSINAIWGVKAKPRQGLLKMVKDRLLSFAMVVSLGFLLLVSLVVDAGLAALHRTLNGFIPDVAHRLFTLANYAFNLAVVTFIFTMLYRFLPDAKVRIRDVWTGALLTTLLFVAGKFLIGFYLGHADVASSFGAAGSLIVVLVWVYYSSQILFLGAEFTKVSTRDRGRDIRPADDAVRVVKKELKIA
jgi:membrane protein